MASTDDESQESQKRQPRNHKLIDHSPDNDNKHENRKKEKYTQKISKQKSMTQPPESSTLKHKNNPPTSPWAAEKSKARPLESSTLKQKNNPRTSPRKLVKRKHVEADPPARTVLLASSDVEDGCYEQREETLEEKEEVEDRSLKRSKLNSGVPQKVKSSATNLMSSDERTAKIKAAAERLRKGYQEAEEKKTKGSVKFVDPKDVPKQRIDNPGGNRFFYGRKKKKND